MGCNFISLLLLVCVHTGCIKFSIAFKGTESFFKCWNASIQASIVRSSKRIGHDTWQITRDGITREHHTTCMVTGNTIRIEWCDRPTDQRSRSLSIFAHRPVCLASCGVISLFSLVVCTLFLAPLDTLSHTLPIHSTNTHIPPPVLDVLWLSYYHSFSAFLWLLAGHRCEHVTGRFWWFRTACRSRSVTISIHTHLYLLLPRTIPLEIQHRWQKQVLVSFVTHTLSHTLVLVLVNTLLPYFLT